MQVLWIFLLISRCLGLWRMSLGNLQSWYFFLPNLILVNYNCMIIDIGQVPYPGMNYNDEFLDNLIEGKRPAKPQYATKEMYDLYHCKCF